MPSLVLKPTNKPVKSCFAAPQQLAAQKRVRKTNYRFTPTIAVAI